MTMLLMSSTENRRSKKRWGETTYSGYSFQTVTEQGRYGGGLRERQIKPMFPDEQGVDLRPKTLRC